MDKFKLHDRATELSSSKSSYKLARELLELQEQYTIYEQKVAGYTEMLEQLLKVNKVLMVMLNELDFCKKNNINTILTSARENAIMGLYDKTKKRKN